MGLTVTLDDRTIWTIAHRTNELVLSNLLELGIEELPAKIIQALSETSTHTGQQPRLVDANELAKILGVHRDTVYTHKHLLGGIPIGDGKKPRWRFDPEHARETWTHRSPRESSPPEKTPATSAKPRRRRKPANGSTRELLPIRAPLNPQPQTPAA